MKISTSRGHLTLSDVPDTIVGVNGLAVGTSVGFQCRYPNGVTTTSNIFTVKDSLVLDQTFAYGSLDQNFGIQLFSNSDFSNAVNSDIFIGTTVFASATFYTTLNQHLDFYIKNCQLKIDVTPIKLISGMRLLKINIIFFINLIKNFEYN